MRAFEPVADRPAGLTAAVRHALAWLVFGNAIGVMIALLLLVPGLNTWLGEWTYGRWMMVHMNTALFGWCSLPMLGLLFSAYGAEGGALHAWCRPVVWLWSAALVVGSYSWLSGHSSGKLFLDWTGFARLFFPIAIMAVWVLLVASFVRGGRATSRAASVAKVAGLIFLFAVPFAIYFASSPGVYPNVNPDTGGPTAASQLESSLGIVLILLALPFALAPRRENSNRIVRVAWVLFAAEALLCAAMGRADISHRAPGQYLSLASLLVWLPLVPAYYGAFAWNPATRPWRLAFLWWWGGLVVTGWVLFLPGVLDRFKFTDMLVGHSLTAVAGFLSAFLLFVMVQLIGERDAWILNRTWSFHAWNMGVLAYVIVMAIAGWMESVDPAFTIVPGVTRNVLYTIRLLTGVSMLAGSAEWLLASLSLQIKSAPAQMEAQGVGVA